VKEGIDQNDEGWPHGKPAEPDLLVIVGNALDAAIRSIQKQLGNKSGDVAAHFFDSEAGETIMEILKDYVQQEIAMSDDLTENAGAPNQQAHELAQQALGAAVRYIQDELNVSEEDEEIAYEYFSDNYTDQILDMFVEFIEHQVDAQHNGDAPPYDEELNEITGDDKFDNMMGKITKGARYKGAAADQRADAAFGGMMNNVTKNAADVAKPSDNSKFEQIYSAVERTLLNSHVHSEIDSDIMDVLEKLKIKATDALIQKLERELINRVSDALQYYDDSDLEENFGGGMRDRPGSDTKSFDLAECKAFLAKRVLKG
jgi:hypothetical protein